MAQEYQNYIGGRWAAAKSGERFERENPATGEITGSYPRSRDDDGCRLTAATYRSIRCERF